MKSILLVGAALLLMLGILATPEAKASGKLSIQANYFTQQYRFAPTVGLAVYERLLPGLVAYNSWSGFGVQPFDLREDAQWWTSKHDLDVFLTGRLIASAGVRFSFVEPYAQWNNDVHVKLSYQLW